MPHPPGTYAPFYRHCDQIPENKTAHKCQDTERQRNKQFIARKNAQAERLQQIQYHKYNDTVYQAILDPVATPLKRIFSIEKGHTLRFTDTLQK